MRAQQRGAVGLVVLGGLIPALMPLLRPDVADRLYSMSSLIFPVWPTIWTLRVVRTADPATQRAWRWILAGVLGFFAYEVLWLLQWLVGFDTNGSLKDGIYLIFGPLVLLGIMRGATVPPDHGGRRRAIVDALIIMVAVGACGGLVLTLGGTFRRLESVRDVALVIAPLLDVLTLGGLALVWVRRDHAHVPPWAVWFSGSLLASIVGDVYYALPYSVGHESPWFVRVAWYASWTTIGMGATLARQPRPVLPSVHLAPTRLPYVMALLGYGSLAYAVFHEDQHLLEMLLVITVGVLTLLVLVRQMLGMRELEAVSIERANLVADTRLATLVRRGSELIALADAEGVICFASPSHEPVFGVPPERMLGVRLVDRAHPDDAPALQAAFRAMLDGGVAQVSMRARFAHADESWRWIDGVITDLRHEPDIGGIVLNGRDVTERHQLEARLQDQVLKDALTGLGNRRLFRTRVEHALARHQRTGTPLAVLFLDLDHFKLVNDTQGHAAGDALLVCVAGRLVAALRASDTIARLGGDEFAVLLEDIATPADAEQAAVRIQAALERPITIDEREHVVKASIGIAQAGEGHDADELLADADAAMYAAKQAGRGRLQWYSSQMRDQARERLELEAELRQALARDELTLVYQPVLHVATGRISGVEALVRWRHPERGIVPPARFIPLAEESDLIVEIGRVALRRAAEDLAWIRQAAPNAATLHVGVNVSPRHVLLPDLVQDVRDAASSAGIAPDAFILEMTETVLARHEALIATRLQQLQAIGVQISLDDFGTGYSSLAYLRRFPINMIKIDRSFLADHDADVDADGVLRAIVSIGQSLGLSTIAEGVETERQLEQLVRLGCPYAQGFVIARPGDREALAALLRSWDAEGMRVRLGGGSLAA